MAEIIKLESITDVHEFYGIEKPSHPLVSVLPITEETFDYGDAGYSMNLYMISLKVGISGRLGYGRNSYDFEEGSMLFSKPYQVLRVMNEENVPGRSGWSLLFHPDLLLKSELGRKIEQYSFFSYEVSEALHLSERERESVSVLIEKIDEECRMNIDRHSQTLIVANIGLLLDYCTRYYDRQFYTRSNLNKDVVTRFERLVTTYFDSDLASEQGLLTVKFCAAELNMSSHYLSDLLKKETGSSAQDHIYRALISKAKTLLLGTPQTISEIAYSLGFEYSQHFSKLFKSKTGMSPGAFRNLN
ncbi:MAG: helix-turn-helix transcriptional regulator [Bacteroidota bacterium]